MGHAKVLEIIFAILALVFVFWPSTALKWIVFAVALVVLIHAIACKCCCSCEMEEKPAKRKK